MHRWKEKEGRKDGLWKEEVTVVGPYDFDRALRRMAFDPLNAVDLKKRSIRVPLFVNERAETAEVQALGTTENPRFIVRSDAENKDALLKKIYSIFKWDTPLIDVSRHFQNTALASLFCVFRGNPLVCEFDLYRSLTKSIIHQQLNLKFASAITERFVKTFGFAKDGVWFYPSPAAVAELEYCQLQTLQFSRRKAEYVIDTARLMTKGALNLTELVQKNDEEVIGILTNVRGIGRWTAESVLLFGLGRNNLLPAGDVGLKNAIKNYFSLPEKPTSAEIRKMATEWEPYQSYASLYLWESLGNHSKTG